MEHNVRGIQMNSSAGNINLDNLEPCPNCKREIWIRYLPCRDCGYDEGTPI